MRTKQLESIIEAILFTMGDSVEVSKIASAIEQDVPTTEKLIHNMMDKYQKEERGIRIIELDHAYQLCSKPEMYETSAAFWNNRRISAQIQCAVFR